jgi:uncharacterized protein YycO
MRPVLILAAAVAVVCSSTGCWHGSLHADRPKDRLVDDAINKMWAAEIRRVARDGDWILSRSLTPQGDMISAVTLSGEKFSHASIVDVTHGTIVEGITPAVREIPLEELMARNWYVVVVRPSGLTAEESKIALDRARSQIGIAFDLWGFVGFQEESKWYCTELLWWASGFEAKHGKQVVIFPNELMDVGEVVYYSGRRDDRQVQAIAAARVNSGHDTAVAGASTAGTGAEVEIVP